MTGVYIQHAQNEPSMEAGVSVSRLDYWDSLHWQVAAFTVSVRWEFHSDSAHLGQCKFKA